MGSKAYVGFGLGAIQCGLLLHEALRAGSFDRFTVIEVEPALIEAVHSNGNRLAINVATMRDILQIELAGFELLNANDPQDQAAIRRAIREADELATAIPSVAHYDSGGPDSIARLLAENLDPERNQILYTAENHNQAAEVLLGKMERYSPAAHLPRFRALNTVIAKMCGVIAADSVIEGKRLAPMTPGNPKAMLVEAFNQILIAKIGLPGVTSGFPNFSERAELLPYQHMKLFGHNAIHSLLGYLAQRRGYAFMSDIRHDAELMNLSRHVLENELGPALIAEYGAVPDPLFTPGGFAAYADQLVGRIVNPFLCDAVERICRHPVRKLGWNDRIIGAMRLCLRHNIPATGMARTAAAALRTIDPAIQSTEQLSGRLQRIWEGEAAEPEQSACVRLILESLESAQDNALPRH